MSDEFLIEAITPTIRDTCLSTDEYIEVLKNSLCSNLGVPADLYRGSAAYGTNVVMDRILQTKINPLIAGFESRRYGYNHEYEYAYALARFACSRPNPERVSAEIHDWVNEGF